MKNPLARIQLPEDVIAQGYKQTRPYHHEQVFYSPKHEFTGTEHEFLLAGLAYEYVQTSQHTRVAFA